MIVACWDCNFWDVVPMSVILWLTHTAEPENITSLGLLLIKYHCHQGFFLYMSSLFISFCQALILYNIQPLLYMILTYQDTSTKLPVTFLPRTTLYKSIACGYFLFNIIINSQHYNTSQHCQLYLYISQRQLTKLKKSHYWHKSASIRWVSNNSSARGGQAWMNKTLACQFKGKQDSL
jgi:hypothetical protein